MLDFNSFKSAPKKITKKHLPAHTLRVLEVSMAISNDVFERLATTEFRAYAEIRYSAQEKAVQLIKRSSLKENGAPFVRRKKGTTARLTPIPLTMQKILNITPGTYTEHPDYPLVFVWSAPLQDLPTSRSKRSTSYYDNEPMPAAGDIVSWFVELARNAKPIIVTGKVRSVGERTYNGEVDTWALIEPMTRNYLDTFPSRKTALIKTSKLIIREKSK